ncbi:MAG TPA: N-acetylglucosamine-6-phosphate deacetylase [Prolixibacteraceae bacterium]|nr:N-acetylglucosamine-6-phosphate deacetylase [Prolixibacteraceae bacterium]HCU63863.1 N-acetylglucosamine-6-phosphate deacetylase [Prolixibacteraceae bacterium]
MRLKIASCAMIFFYSLLASAEKNDTITIEGLLYSDGQPVSIQIINGKIFGIRHLPDDADIPRVYIAPGLIDLQVNGYMGIDFCDPALTAEDVRKVVKALWKEGVTTFFPTLTTNADDLLKRNFGVLAETLNDPEMTGSIPGFHLEGPYISPVQGYRGDHPEKHIRKPDRQEFEKYQQAARGAIKLITVAPEIEGAIPFIAQCAKAGVVVALGHHNASAEIVKEAVDAGASMSTHLGNGCANEINRHHNPIWPQLADDRLMPSIIVDGYHLTWEEVQTFYKVKGPDRIILVSDVVDLAGLPPGEYKKGDVTLLLTPEVVKYPAENVLSGAASPIRLCVGNIMKFTGCNLNDAIRMASTNPAKAVGLDNVGEIGLGKKADLIVFTIDREHLQIQKTIVCGKIVYSRRQ